MRIDQLPNYITQQELELEKVRRETVETELKQLQVLQHSNRTINDLEEYRRNRLLIDAVSNINKINSNQKKTIISIFTALLQTLKADP
jgi:glutamyl-tRNA reductase